MQPESYRRINEIVEDLKLRRPELVEAFVEGLLREEATGPAGGPLGIELTGPTLSLGAAERLIWSKALQQLKKIGEASLSKLVLPGQAAPELMRTELSGGRTVIMLITDVLDARAMQMVPRFVHSFHGVEARRAFFWGEGAESPGDSPFPRATIAHILARAGVSRHDPFHSIADPAVLQSVLTSPKLAADGVDNEVLLGYVVARQAMISNRSAPFEAPAVIERLRKPWHGIATTRELYEATRFYCERATGEEAQGCMGRIYELLGSRAKEALGSAETIQELLAVLSAPEEGFEPALILGCAIALSAPARSAAHNYPDLAFWATRAFPRWGDVVSFDDLHRGLVRVTEPHNNFTPEIANSLAGLIWRAENEISERHMRRLLAEQPECKHLGIFCSPRYADTVLRVLG